MVQAHEAAAAQVEQGQQHYEVGDAQRNAVVQYCQATEFREPARIAVQRLALIAQNPAGLTQPFPRGAYVFAGERATRVGGDLPAVLPMNRGHGYGHNSHQRDAGHPGGQAETQHHGSPNLGRRGKKRHQLRQGVTQPVEIAGGKLETLVRMPLVHPGNPEHRYEVHTNRQGRQPVGKLQALHHVTGHSDHIVEKITHGRAE